MNCEEMLVEQVKKTTQASPGTTVWVYRNGIKALPWYTLVREKVTDPAYARWFMKFSPEVISNHSAAHVPVCDTNYHPPRCSDLYHDQKQTPGYPRGDGDCTAPGCDVGSVPIGEYLVSRLSTPSTPSLFPGLYWLTLTAAVSSALPTCRLI